MIETIGSFESSKCGKNAPDIVSEPNLGLRMQIVRIGQDYKDSIPRRADTQVEEKPERVFTDVIETFRIVTMKAQVLRFCFQTNTRNLCT